MKYIKYVILVLILVILILISYCGFFEVGFFNKNLTDDLSFVMVPHKFVARPYSFLPYLADQNRQYFDALQPTLFHRSPNFVRFLMLTLGQFFLSVELYFNESEASRVFDETLIIVPFAAIGLEVCIWFAKDFVHCYVLLCFQDLFFELTTCVTAFEWYVWCCNLICVPEGRLYASFLYDFMPIFKEIKMLIFKKDLIFQDVIDLGIHLDAAKLKLTTFEAHFKELYPNKELPNSFYQIHFKVDMMREVYLQKFPYIKHY